MEKRKPITPKDVASFIGVEKLYADLLFEQELQQAYDTVMGDCEEDVESDIRDSESNQINH